MANANIRSKIRANRHDPKSVNLLAWRRKGYNDRINYAPYCKEYDSAHVMEQWAYENGRLQASNMLLAEIPLPVWKNNVILPHSYNDAIKLAREIVGTHRVDSTTHMVAE